MKPAKMERLVRDVLDARRVIGDAPITFDTLSIDFDAHRVTFRGRTINVDSPVVTFPVLSTDRLVVTKNGEDVL